MRIDPYAGLFAALLLACMQPVIAQEDAPATPEDDQLRAAYEQAMAEAERQRAQAQTAVEQAQEELQRSAEERAMASAQAAEAREQAREQRRLEDAEVEAMRRELSRAQEELRRASREVVRVHRELERGHSHAPLAEVVSSGRRAVIGVVLGESTDAGVQVLGVSPDGPAERAGIQQGDVIVSVMGERLVTDTGEKAGQVLLEAMRGVKPGDELEIAVERDGEEQTFAVTAEAREPVGWASMIRLPSVPDAPDAPIVIERIEVPNIDREALEEKMAQLERELEKRRIVIERAGSELERIAPQVWEFEFENLSELGEEAMHSANVWFGMPMTRGLKLAEVNAELGDYFKTDHGVLVLKAEADNDLQLQSGDVVTAVGGKRVDRPADLMRELRRMEPGMELEIEIMRQRRSRTLDVVVPEQRMGYLHAPEAEHEYIYRVEVQTD